MKVLTFIMFLALVVYSCTSVKEEKIVTEEALLNAAIDDTEWLTYGSNYSETRFSKLNQINDQNAKDIGLA